MKALARHSSAYSTEVESSNGALEITLSNGQKVHIREEPGGPTVPGVDAPCAPQGAGTVSGDAGDFFRDELPTIMEGICPTSLAEAMDRDRPYSGQPHTDHGKRGETFVQGLTYRDVRDCFIRACYDASGMEPKDWPGSVDDLPWERMSPIAVQQNMSIWMEKYQGIYPNVPRIVPADPTHDHWCGPTLDRSTWQRHDGTCEQPTNVRPGEDQ